MSPIKRAVRGTLQLAAVGLIVIGTLSIGVEYMRHRMRSTDINVWRCILWCVPVLVGALLLLKSTAIASRLTEDFDDES